MFILFWQFCFTISDAAIVALLVLLCKYFEKLSAHCEGIVQKFSKGIPKTLRSAAKLIGLSNDHLTQYIVCPSCNSVFTSTLVMLWNMVRVPNKCPHVAMPNHPFPSQRKPCGTLLMKAIRGKGGCGNIILQPNKVFPYQSLVYALTKLMSRKGILECCEIWRKRDTIIPSHVLADVYEGSVWRDFL